MKRRGLAALSCAAALAAASADAQVPAKTAEVCFLYPGPAGALAERADLFALGLKDQGVEIGRDVVVLAHASEFDPGRLAAFVADCVTRKVRVIVAVAQAVAAAHAAT